MPPSRIGGDEFMLLLPHTRIGEGRMVAEKLRVALGSAPVLSASGPVRVTASLGAVRASTATPSVDELLSLTHLVLRRSKLDGKNRTTSDQPGEEGAASELQGVMASLQSGKGLRAVKQAIFRLSDEHAVGYEFLTRAPAGVFSMPDDFFRVSAESNVLTLVDHHCLKACLAAGRALAPLGRLHLNLFPSTLMDIPVRHLLESFHAAPAKGTWCLEISEQQVIGDPSHLAAPVAELRAAGVGIAIDDVGFGHSCLESLILLEPEVVKIDRHCIAGIAGDARRAHAMERLLKVAGSLGAEVIAEGIETRADLEQVKALGVTLGQGFLWGRPE